MAKNRIKRAVTSTARALGKEIAGTGGERGTEGVVISEEIIENILAAWPATPRDVARTTIQQYGPPNEGTPSLLIWYNNGPWKRTIIYRDEVPHNFPKPHTDVLEQFINYRVPPDKFDDVAGFDGSVVPERTKGEVSARCDMEAMNFLALNLMHDIVIGARSPEDARREYAEQAMAFVLKRPAPYTERLRFEVPREGTADLDEITLSPMMKEAMNPR